MNNADIQYQKLVRLMDDMNKRLIKIEAAVSKRPPKAIETPSKVNAAEG